MESEENMIRYIGFDLGDGESAVASFEQGSSIEPVILPIAGTKSLITAVGLVDGDIVIGENAYTNALASSLSVRFKSKFTQNTYCYEDIVRFAKGVYQELSEFGSINPEDRFVVGCPASWNTAARARYRDLLVRAGFSDPRVISESRAAFLYAKYAKTVALDVDILNDSALVIDIGSSTLDYAYIVDGRESGVGTFGETSLGGGLLDAALLRRAVDRSRSCEEIRSVFRESRSWYSYCEIEMRRLKEEYFNRLLEEEHPVVKKVVRIYYDTPLKLHLIVDDEAIRHAVYEGIQELDGRSFYQTLHDSVAYARHITENRLPKLLLLTGGASRMGFFRDICRELFSEALVVCCPEPEFSIAKGLAYAGWVDENLQSFREAVQTEITDERVSEVAQKELGEQIPELVTVLTELLIEQAAIPVTQLWKDGSISTLEELNSRLNERVKSVLNSPMTKEAITPIIEKWVSGLSDDLQAMVDPICDRYQVPRKQMRLNLSSSGENASDLDAGQWVGLPLIGGVVGVSLSVIFGLICGGGGIALVTAGPVGFITGACVGAILTLIGWDFVAKGLMKAKLPTLLRLINVEKTMRSDKVRGQIAQALNEALLPENGEFRTKTVQGFSASFRSYLYSIAQAAEIPIG